jgi:Na+/H+-dicarboxylate symporter
MLNFIGDPEAGMLTPFFTIPLTPLIDVTSAVVLAFILGLCISSMRGKELHDALYTPISEFAIIINAVLRSVIIPLLPLYICGTFVNMTVSGQTFFILNILWKVFLTVIILHLSYILIQFLVGGTISKKNPFVLIKNQIPGYLSAVGTQSSAATIPVNLKCAEADGVSREIRNFVIPLCANIHMAGSMITITCCVTATLLIYNMPINLGIIVPFIMTLAIAMVASPGAPGGSIMTALPFLPLVGIASDGAIASLLIALYITQDSFGTACNVSGDNAISVVIETIYQRFIKTKDKAAAA